MAGRLGRLGWAAGFLAWRWQLAGSWPGGEGEAGSGRLPDRCSSSLSKHCMEEKEGLSYLLWWTGRGLDGGFPNFPHSFFPFHPSFPIPSLPSFLPSAFSTWPCLPLPGLPYLPGRQAGSGYYRDSHSREAGAGSMDLRIPGVLDFMTCD